MPPRVWNQRFEHPPDDAVYVGRPTMWGNPFRISREVSRQRAVEMYREYIAGHPEVQKRIREELAGKDLICWCAPLACHADVLLEIANNEPRPTWEEMERRLQYAERAILGAYVPLRWPGFREKRVEWDTALRALSEYILRFRPDCFEQDGIYRAYEELRSAGVMRTPGEEESDDERAG